MTILVQIQYFLIKNKFKVHNNKQEMYFLKVNDKEEKKLNWPTLPI